MIKNTLAAVQWQAFEREYAKCVVTPEGHRLWQGRVDHDGYGAFRFVDAVSRNRRDIGAHRLSYMRWGEDDAILMMREAFGVFLPDRLHLIHTHGCPRNCVEPSHIGLRAKQVLKRFQKMRETDAKKARS